MSDRQIAWPATDYIVAGRGWLLSAIFKSLLLAVFTQLCTVIYAPNYERLCIRIYMHSFVCACVKVYLYKIAHCTLKQTKIFK